MVSVWTPFPWERPLLSCPDLLCSLVGGVFLLPKLERVLLLSLFSSCLPPVQVRASILVILVQFMFRKPHWWDFTGVAFNISRRRHLTTNSLSLSLLSCSAPSLTKVPESWVHERFVDVYIGTFDQLWFSFLFSSCSKEKFCWWGMRTILLCGYKDKQTIVRDYTVR